MAQRTEQTSSKTQAVAQPKSIWWVMPSLLGGCLAGFVFAYLHVHFGGTSITHAAAIAVANVAIFLLTYSIISRLHPGADDSSFKALLWSIAVSIPVFVVAFIGLGKEIAVLADFTGMYVLGVWIASAETAERAQ